MTKKKPMPTGTPYCHLELLSTMGERPMADGGVGDQSFVLILKPDYQTDAAFKQLILDSLQHSAEALNGTVPKDKPNWPYIAYDEDVPFGGVNRTSSWLYLSLRNIPEQEAEIEAWMLAIMTAWMQSKGYTPEQIAKKMKVDYDTNAARIKIAFASTVLAPVT